MSGNTVIEKIGRPYAEALLSITEEKKLTDQVSSDANFLLNLLNENEKLSRILSSPLLKRDYKKNLIQETFYNQIHTQTLNFLRLLVDRNRIYYVAFILNKYIELSYKSKGIQVAYLTSATSINETQQEAIEEKVRFISGAKEVKLITTIDSELLAGFTLKINSSIIDMSLLGEMKQIASHLGTSLT